MTVTSNKNITSEKKLSSPSRICLTSSYLFRQGYDERYGFYETVHRENYGNREYNYEPPVGVSREKGTVHFLVAVFDFLVFP